MANYNYTKFFAEKGYDIYDKNGSFYKDICSPAYIGKADIVIKNRKKYIYPNNVTLCEYDCTYKGINIEEERIICSCNLNSNKKNTDENEDSFLEEGDDGNFISYFLDNINYKIFKCYFLISRFENLKNNYAYTISGIFFIIIVINLFFRFRSVPHFNSSMLRKTPTEKKLKVKVKEKIRQKLPRKRSSINKLNNPIKRKKIKSNTNILKNSNLLKKKFPKIKRHKSCRFVNRRLNHNNNKTDKMD